MASENNELVYTSTCPFDSKSTRCIKCMLYILDENFEHDCAVNIIAYTLREIAEKLAKR